MAAVEQLRCGETKIVRGRGRKGIRRARNFNANLGNKLTVTEGCPISSATPASPDGIRAAAMASLEQGRQLRYPRAGVEKRCGAMRFIRARKGVGGTPKEGDGVGAGTWRGSGVRSGYER